MSLGVQGPVPHGHPGTALLLDCRTQFLGPVAVICGCSFNGLLVTAMLSTDHNLRNHIWLVRPQCTLFLIL